MSGLVHVDPSLIGDRLKRILLIDDDDEYAQKVTANLALNGFTTESVGSLGAATEVLKREQFPLVFCDNVFENFPERKGSEFVAKSSGLFQQSKVVLLTGYALNQIVNREVLNEKGVIIVQKGLGHIDQLKTISAETIETKSREIASQLEYLCETIIGTIDSEGDLRGLAASPHLLTRAASYLTRYISTLPDQSEKQIFMAGRAFSPRDLLLEISTGSETGRQLVDMLLDEVLSEEVRR